MSLTRRVLFRLATSDRFERTLLAVGPARAAAYRAALRYVAGTTRNDAFAVARRLHAIGEEASIDLFGENAASLQLAEAEAERFVELAAHLAQLPGQPFLSIDLSHIGLDLDRGRCADHLARIVSALPPTATVQIGAEEERRTDAIHDVATRCKHGTGRAVEMTLQANLRRSPDDARRLVAAGLGVRLVKGAYVEEPTVSLPWGPEVDDAYVRLAGLLGELRADYSLATHDDAVRARALAVGATRRAELLLGIRPDSGAELRSQGLQVRRYVPYGQRWFRYWMRRVAESRGTA